MTARMVWERHTNPVSELSMAKKRLAERKVQSKQKVEESHVPSSGIKRLEEAAPKHLVKGNLEKVKIYEDVRNVSSLAKIENQKPGDDNGAKNAKFLGLDMSQLLVVIMVIFVCLILYSVLLHLTVQAAQCQDTLETIMKERKEWQKKVMDVTRRQR